jgi:hypothetical protein
MIHFSKLNLTINDYPQKLKFCGHSDSLVRNHRWILKIFEKHRTIHDIKEIDIHTVSSFLFERLDINCKNIVVSEQYTFRSALYNLLNSIKVDNVPNYTINLRLQKFQ